jgi:hypothetical protein
VTRRGAYNWRKKIPQASMEDATVQNFAFWRSLLTLSVFPARRPWLQGLM